jgi:hypothetical protein
MRAYQRPEALRGTPFFCSQKEVHTLFHIGLGAYDAGLRAQIEAKTQGARVSREINDTPCERSGLLNCRGAFDSIIILQYLKRVEFKGKKILAKKALDRSVNPCDTEFS